MRSAVGGTFNVLHEGHKELLDAAFRNSDEVFIGITSDAMASASRDRINPFTIRKNAVKEYAERKDIPFSIFEISDPFGPAVEFADLDVLVVSEETAETGKQINNERKRRGLRPITLEIIGMRKGPDGNVISSREIIKGSYSRSGNVNAIRIAVGSTNPVKVEAVRTVMERIYRDVIVIATDVRSGVPEQPWEEDTCKGAVNRAKNALGDNDLSVGVEAGVFERYDGIYDVQHCAVVDRDENITIGTSSGFRYPDDVAALLMKGMTVGDAMKELYGENKGKAEGAVGLLSRGLLDRKSLTEQSVTAAMIPRMKDIVP